MKLKNKETVISYEITEITPNELNTIEQALELAEFRSSPSGYGIARYNLVSQFRELLSSLRQQK